MEIQHVKIDRKELFGGILEPTPIQRQIEMGITNGLGYDTKTKYMKRYDAYGMLRLEDYIEGDSSRPFGFFSNYQEIHDTQEGLMNHLADLDERMFYEKLDQKVA